MSNINIHSYPTTHINRNKPVNASSVTLNAIVLLVGLPMEGVIIQVTSNIPGFVVIISTKLVLPLTDGCN